MKTSSDFHTGGVLLLTATVICAGLAVTVLAPLLHRDSHPQATVAVDNSDTDAGAVNAEKFSEFYPTLADARRELRRFDGVMGPALRQSPESRTADAALSSVFDDPDSTQKSVSGSATHGPTVARQSTPKNASAEPVLREPAEPQRAWSPGRNWRVAEVPRSAEPGFSRSTEATINRLRPWLPDEQQSAVAPKSEAAVMVNQPPPGQMPAGSVYAPITVHPVTVNVDGTIFSQQMQAMSERFEKILSEREQVTAADDQRTRRAGRERSRTRQGRNQGTDEEIVRIETGLEQLVQSIQALQMETQSGLKHLSVQAERAGIQADRAQAATQMMQSYEKLLAEKLTLLDQAERTQVALAPAETYSDSATLPKAPQNSVTRVEREPTPTPKSKASERLPSVPRTEPFPAAPAVIVDRKLSPPAEIVEMTVKVAPVVEAPVSGTDGRSAAVTPTRRLPNLSVLLRNSVGRWN